jgi:hypothetical protein
MDDEHSKKSTEFRAQTGQRPFREQARVAVGWPGTVAVADDEEATQAKVEILDLGLGGASLRGGRGWKTGQHLVLRIVHPDMPSDPLTVEGVIKWVRAGKEVAGQQLGVCFPQVPPEDAARLLQWLAAVPQVGEF